MAHLIDKDALVVEIERRKKYYENIQMIKTVYESNIEDFNELLSFLNTIEVKEVDLEKEIEEHSYSMPQSEFAHDDEVQDNMNWAREEFRYFFELGLKAQK